MDLQFGCFILTSISLFSGAEIKTTGNHILLWLLSVCKIVKTDTTEALTLLLPLFWLTVAHNHLIGPYDIIRRDIGRPPPIYCTMTDGWCMAE